MAMTLGAPVIMVLVFGYIFGSAIAVPGRGNYRIDRSPDEPRYGSVEYPSPFRK
jgi:hypothetical protein